MQVCLSNLCVYDAHVHCKTYIDVLCDSFMLFPKAFLIVSSYLHCVSVPYQNSCVILFSFHTYVFTSHHSTAFLYSVSDFLSTCNCLIYRKCFMPNLPTCLIFAKQRALSLFTSVKRTCFISLTHPVVCRHWLRVDLEKRI
ncbi:unnamed protein product [Ixodes hexagonus]